MTKRKKGRYKIMKETKIERKKGGRKGRRGEKNRQENKKRKTENGK